MLFCDVWRTLLLKIYFKWFVWSIAERCCLKRADAQTGPDEWMQCQRGYQLTEFIESDSTQTYRRASKIHSLISLSISFIHMHSNSHLFILTRRPHTVNGYRYSMSRIMLLPVGKYGCSTHKHNIFFPVDFGKDESRAGIKNFRNSNSRRQNPLEMLKSLEIHAVDASNIMPHGVFEQFYLPAIVSRRTQNRKTKTNRFSLKTSVRFLHRYWNKQNGEMYSFR